MNKRTLWNIALVLLPVLSLMAAGAANSVMVFDSVTNASNYYSYFALIEGMEFAVCLPLAALLCGVTLMLACFCVLSKKEKLMKPIAVIAFIAMFCAVVPLLIKGETVVLPNMLVPIAMGVTSLLAYMRSRTSQTVENKKSGGPRLK